MEFPPLGPSPSSSPLSTHAQSVCFWVGLVYQQMGTFVQFPGNRLESGLKLLPLEGRKLKDDHLSLERYV